MGHRGGPQLQQTLQSLRRAWEGYKRTQGMMCAASSRSLAAQLAAPAAAAAGVAVAEPAGSLLPAVGSVARHLGTAGARTLSTALHQSWGVCLQPWETSQGAWQPYHWAEQVHLEGLWLA